MVGQSRAARLAAGLTVAAALANAAPAVTGVPAVRSRLWPGLSGPGAGYVALTFDDGPARASTPLFLRALAQARVRATFFLLGRMLDRDPGLGREIVAGGHDVAVHGWEHRNLLWRTPAATYGDIARARNRIAEVTGVLPVWYRPPYGVLTTAALLACRRLGLRPRLWTTWGRDWESGATPASVFRTVTRALGGGGTVLLHDSDALTAPSAWRATLGALPVLIADARRRGLTVGPLVDHATGRGPEWEARRFGRHAANGAEIWG
ncbi:Peptidoglycan/xylan/chitin deacetylase, PgdA/CDA1 family [Micromonospora pattaloongensis]|uniref:Peptidoglycan/xylan/chitin deacetylase, PgdA/CDA1 family n=1 Tax=Micromonospora pattaloongensis TaxID=405436 RepID=A0A1H3JKB1_9ACTN|nr:polysaccharide deacetylase family protein [Micromonospora pattaloongensis]SDY40356.1 Peptidoglycan/xylan/chitin deacetylase, PgdA/CDA1 family [Micromonospora pattaloongensis]